MKERYTDIAQVFKAFGDENRIMILELLRSGERCACVLLERLDIAQSTLSHHMKILVDNGIVNARQEGKWTHYSINEIGKQRVISLLDELTSATDSVQTDSDSNCC